MKVLFAVNSESISEAIIKKYQKDYREILSYKNVYYFNAIQKEIQRDKSYDRIIISEDLEPFSNNNYESIDKFIFEKLDGISDEAHDTQGNEISIILICSDRHTKGSSFLVKLFGIGVYNALLGNDRSMEEVCRLINKPRTKKEAKMYYKIDTDDVNYRAESENEVSELEIQNIISHFKKLGKSTEKYAGSFENIAAQYTDEQLKIIINCLPINVKAVLEETSNKYQEIMSVSGAMVRGVKSTNSATREDQKRTGLKIDIIENKLNQTKMTKPIVIPNSVKSTKSNTAKKVISVPVNSIKNPGTDIQEGQSDRILKRRTQSIDDDNLMTKRVEAKKQVASGEKVLNGKVVSKRPDIGEMNRMPKKVAQSTIENNQEQIQAKTVKPMRRISNAPEKQEIDPLDELGEIELPDLDLGDEIITNNNVSDIKPIKETTPVKKRRGRPRKISPTKIETKPKGKRGRPRKTPIEENVLEKTKGVDDELKQPTQVNQMGDMLPGFDDWEDTELEDIPVLKNNEFTSKPEEEYSEEVSLPELDELDDLDFGDDDDELPGITEESFDEFDDYDEYGVYETKAKSVKKHESIEDLYQEDILSSGNKDMSYDMELPEIDDLDDFEDFEENNETENNSQVELYEEEKGINLLSDFDDENELLSAVDYNENDILNTGTDNDTFLYQDEDFSDDVNLFNAGNAGNSFEDEQNYEPTNDFNYENEALESISSPISYSMSNLNSLMTKDKKIVTFLGTTKNGVSFLVNNLAEIFASVGIDTAILDMTKNKNSYYIYTQNEENLRKIAYTSLEKLQRGLAEGIRVKQNLTVYTALPNDGKDYSNAEPILSTLVQNHSLVLIDCDFDTNPSYFASCQEIYLVQSMDILTIQPLTAFLRDLKTQGVLEPEKVRVVINKELKVRGLTNKAIIGGMSFYNDPAMSFMTELFNKEIVKYCSIPFEEMAYSKYLEAVLNCKVSINGYSKNFVNKLRVLGDMVYPLISRQMYSSNVSQNYNQGGFSNSMNNTLNKMKKKF